MASITITLTGACASQGHTELTITGDRSGILRSHVNEIFNQPLDNELLIQFVYMYIRIWSVGKTKAQIRTGSTKRAGDYDMMRGDNLMKTILTVFLLSAWLFLLVAPSAQATQTATFTVAWEDSCWTSSKPI
jgi:hypothetical protein